MKLIKSATSEINLELSNEISHIEGTSSNNDFLTFICVCKKTITAFTIWWNTVINPYWDTPTSLLWDTHMDSEV